MKKKYYHYSYLEKFISRLINEHGYNCANTEEGCLGIGNWICCPPDDKHYFFVIQEEYVNAWSSRHWMMKYRRLPKQWEEEYLRWEKNEMD